MANSRLPFGQPRGRVINLAWNVCCIYSPPCRPVGWNVMVGPAKNNDASYQARCLRASDEVLSTHCYDNRGIASRSQHSRCSRHSFRGLVSPLFLSYFPSRLHRRFQEHGFTSEEAHLGRRLMIS